MYTLLYAIYAAENGATALAKFRGLLAQGDNTHAGRVTRIIGENPTFAAMLDFMILYHETMKSTQPNANVQTARDAALDHIVKVLDDGLSFASEW